MLVFKEKILARRRSWAVVLCVLWAAVLPASAAADETQEAAKAHFLRGKAAYEQGLYEDAVASFSHASELRPSPILDYNIARCHDKLGQAEPALARYSAYLKARPDAPNRAAVEARIRELQPKPEPKPAKIAPPALKPPPVPGEPVAAPDDASKPEDKAETVNDIADPFASPPAPKHEAHAAGVQSKKDEQKQVDKKGDPEPGAAAIDIPGVPKHEALGAPSGRPAPSRAPLPPPPQDDTPVYKKWYFWVAVVGGLAVAGFVIGTAVSSRDDHQDSASSSTPLLGSGSQPMVGRPVLRF